MPPISTATTTETNPGVIFDTNLQRSMNVPRVVLDAVAGLSNLLVLKSIPEGAATQCYVTTNPALAAVSGEYFADCNKVAVARRTKNGSPTPLHLPSIVVAALANIRADDGRVFRFSKSGRLHALMTQAEKASGVYLPEGIAFHILRHTHATWRRRETGADTTALVGTGLWRSREAAGVYEHLDPTEEAKKSDLLPTPISAKRGRK